MSYFGISSAIARSRLVGIVTERGVPHAAELVNRGTVTSRKQFIGTAKLKPRQIDTRVVKRSAQPHRWDTPPLTRAVRDVQRAALDRVLGPKRVPIMESRAAVMQRLATEALPGKPVAFMQRPQDPEHVVQMYRAVWPPPPLPG